MYQQDLIILNTEFFNINRKKCDCMVLFISNNFIRTYSFETTNYLTINYQQYNYVNNVVKKYLLEWRMV